MQPTPNIEVLKYNRFVLDLLSIYPKDLSIEPKYQFFKSPLAYLFLFSFIFCWMAANIASSSTLIGANLELISPGIQLAGMYFSVGFRLHDVRTLHLKLQEMVNTSKLNVLLFILTILVSKASSTKKRNKY